MPVAGPTALSDGLKAGPQVARAPWTVQALRIGVHRDGSRIGVLAYSQEHAREWATPLVTLEFAERLLANYATDPQTHALLQDVDVFVIPVVNPDGAHYSFNDFNFQRKNMDNYCTGTQRDPAHRDEWGVDVNRNYAVGSLFDGYFGASLDCLNEVSAGTGELSEPESRNVIALAKRTPEHQVRDERALLRRVLHVASRRVQVRRPDHPAASLDRGVGAVPRRRQADRVRDRRAPRHGDLAGASPVRWPTCCTRRPATRPTSCTTSRASSPGTSRSATDVRTRRPSNGRDPASSRRTPRRTRRPWSTPAGWCSWSGWRSSTRTATPRWPPDADAARHPAPVISARGGVRHR